MSFPRGGESDVVRGVKELYWELFVAAMDEIGARLLKTDEVVLEELTETISSSKLPLRCSLSSE